MWEIHIHKNALKELRKIPKSVGLIYLVLLEDLTREGPFPFGWNAVVLKNQDKVRIRLNREYRVILSVGTHEIMIEKVCHRKDAYE